MSRNLGRTTCFFCDSPVIVLENPRPVTIKDAGHYFEEFEGMIVARAICPWCLAQYLAWIDEINRVYDPHSNTSGGLVQNLSFLSTFDDEPGAFDGPKYNVVKKWERTGFIDLYCYNSSEP